MSTEKSGSWTSLSDEELLKIRICDLGLEINGSELEENVQNLYKELEAKGFKHFKPKIYLGDEWFSPHGVPSISIPFFLAHPRLKALEQSIMLEVEGGTPVWFMQLLRHEAGHCFDHAYQFSKRPKFKQLFGSTKEEYNVDSYRPKPYSKSFVRHLDNWYAQAHPDEDFAETFAVWLTPGLDWRKEYSGWSLAKQKLEYVDKLARETANKVPKVIKGPHISSAAKLRSTLGRYYTKRRKDQGDDYPGFYDDDLRRIFNGDRSLAKKEFSAARFLRNNRKAILDSVSYWTGEKKYTVSTFLRKIILRAEVLDLRVGRTESQTNMEVASYLATIITHYLFTGNFERSV